MKSRAIVFGFLGLSWAITSAVHAGEILRLQNGGVKLKDASGEIFARGLNANAQTKAQYVVQFHRAPSEAERQALESQGARVLRYLPDDAYLISAAPRAAGLLKAAMPKQVKAVVSYSPEWRLDRELLGQRLQGSQHLLISVADERDLSSALESVQELSPDAKAISETDISAVVNVAQLQKLSQIEGIEWIQSYPQVVTLDFKVDEAASSPALSLALTGYESGTRLMGFEAAWKRGFEGAGQTVAVADTGLDVGQVASIHPDFAGTLVQGYNAGLGTETWADTNGHGTHVSGSVAGNGVSSNRAFRGGAYASKLLMQGLWSAILDNLAPGTDFKRLIGPVYKDGARIHTNSWGGLSGAYDVMASKVDEYMWRNPDLLVLFAAGNSGADMNRDGHVDEGSLGTPATAKNVLTVGASENLLSEGGLQNPMVKLRDGEKKWGVEPLKSDTLSNNPNGIAAFSSRGPTRDGRLKPEIVAPGTNIVSVRSRDPKASALWGAYDANYAYAGGTSMATPLTAGAAAVAREFLVRERQIANPSAALVKALMIHSAKDLFPGQYGTGSFQELTRRPNVHEGYGRVDMDALTATGKDTEVVDSSVGVGANEEQTFKVTVRGGGLRATLVYTDAPGSPSAAAALVNDLDLKVTGPDGRVSTTADRVNNTEMIELSDVKPGTFEVSVRGVRVAQGKAGKQPFALIITPAPAR
jgi:serine protease AprX